MKDNSNNEGTDLATQPAEEGDGQSRVEWAAITPDSPAEGQIVETKIDDGRGVRNVALLVKHGGLWYFADESMYVYYAPTHWRKPLAQDVEKELAKLSVTAESLDSIRQRVAATATRD